MTHNVAKADLAMLSVPHETSADTDEHEAEHGRESNIEGFTLRSLRRWHMWIYDGPFRNCNRRSGETCSLRGDIECKIIARKALKPSAVGSECYEAPTIGCLRGLKSLNTTNAGVSVVYLDENTGIWFEDGGIPSNYELISRSQPSIRDSRFSVIPYVVSPIYSVSPDDG